jgi:hypothetical protein
VPSRPPQHRRSAQICPVRCERLSHGAASGRNRTARSPLGDRRDRSAHARRRRPPCAVRRDPRRRARLPRASVMRRRPIAVYRVIDEQELLGGEPVEWLGDERAASDRSPVPRPVVRRGSARPRATHRLGWASTASAVAGLVCVALLLLHLASQTRAPVAQRSAVRAGHGEAGGRRVWRVAAPASPRPRPRPAQRRIASRRAPKPPRRSVLPGVVAPLGPRSATVITGSHVSYAPAVAGQGRAAEAQTAAALEFGFER